MIARWENECVSLSVLSVARVMIAQWENECISLSVLSVARVMIARWENECISLSVLSVAQVQFPTVAEYFKGHFPVDHTLPTRPSGASVAENDPSVAPHNLWTSRRKAKGQPWTDNG